MSGAAIQIGFVLVQAAAIHLFVKIIKRRHYDKHIIRAFICAGAALMLHHFACNWILSFFNISEPTLLVHAVSMAILYACAFPLIRYVMQPGLLLTPITCIVLVFTSFGLQVGRQKFPGTETVSNDETNPAESSWIELPKKENNTNAMELVSTVQNGMNAFNALKADKALKSDFKRGVELFKERKEWMDSLTPEEKAAYHAEMRQFLAEQGLAEDPSSLANIRSANPTNQAAMASLFEHIGNMEGGTASARSQNVSESLRTMTASLQGIEVSEADLANMQKVSELLAANDREGAMAEARRQLKESNGKNQLAGTMMAALMQTKSSIPAKMKDKKTFGFNNLLSFGKKKGRASPKRKKGSH